MNAFTNEQIEDMVKHFTTEIATIYAVIQGAGIQLDKDLIEAVRVRMRAEVDQQFMEARDKLIQEMDEEHPGFAAFCNLLNKREP